MIDKVAATPAQALGAVADGATVLVGGFGTAGIPNELVGALIEQGARDLTIVNNNAGNGDTGLAALLKAGRVRKIVCSFPRQTDLETFTFETTIPKAMALVYWPTLDIFDIEKTRRIGMLGSILDDRLRLKIREEVRNQEVSVLLALRGG